MIRMGVTWMVDKWLILLRGGGAYMIVAMGVPPK